MLYSAASDLSSSHHRNPPMGAPIIEILSNQTSQLAINHLLPKLHNLLTFCLRSLLLWRFNSLFLLSFFQRRLGTVGSSGAAAHEVRSPPRPTGNCLIWLKQATTAPAHCIYNHPLTPIHSNKYTQIQIQIQIQIHANKQPPRQRIAYITTH